MRLGLTFALYAGIAAFAVGGVAYVRHLQHETAVARSQAETAKDDAEARGLEAGGEVQSAQRVEVVVRQVRAADQATSTLSVAAHEAPDAQDLIPDDRAARLLAHDLELCRISPRICPAAAVDDAESGNRTVRAVQTAPSPDAG